MKSANVSKEIKIKAQNEVVKALLTGELEREPCEICGDWPGHAHHDDYSKPLEVRWLCPSHHKIWHTNSGSQICWTAGQLCNCISVLRAQGKLGKGYLPKVLRLTQNDAGKLRIAARKADIPEAAYVQIALCAQFKKDGIE
jgi:hypothetical protein